MTILISNFWPNSASGNWNGNQYARQRGGKSSQQSKWGHKGKHLTQPVWMVLKFLERTIAKWKRMLSWQWQKCLAWSRLVQRNIGRGKLAVLVNSVFLPFYNMRMTEFLSYSVKLSTIYFLKQLKQFLRRFVPTGVVVWGVTFSCQLVQVVHTCSLVMFAGFTVAAPGEVASFSV